MAAETAVLNGADSSLSADLGIQSNGRVQLMPQRYDGGPLGPFGEREWRDLDRHIRQRPVLHGSGVHPGGVQGHRGEDGTCDRHGGGKRALLWANRAIGGSWG